MSGQDADRRVPVRWGSRWGVRTRLTVLATSVTAAGLVLAGLLLVVVARAALLATVDDAGRQRGREVAGLVDAGTVPDPLPVTGAAVVQVLDESGRVRSSSPGGDRLTPLLGPQDVNRVRDGEVVRLDGSRLGSRETFRVLGVRAGQGGRQTVLVASSASAVSRGLLVVIAATAVAVPALVLVVGLLVRRVSASALRPVERLRLGAAAVGPPGGDRPGVRRPLPVPPSGDEVARLASTLNDMLARLDDASARERVFVADAAHELRSPIASLRTQLEVALARPDRQDWPRVARDGLVDVRRLGVLVDDLLLLARVGSGAEPPASGRPVDLELLVRERTAAARRVPVVLEPTAAHDRGCLLVHGSARSFERLVENLLDNAARHASSRVVVRLRRVPEPPTVVLKVQDDGPGIAAADRERVFERFARLDAARDRDAGGAGLGLAIVRAVAEAASGSVRVSGAEEGTPGADDGTSGVAGARGGSARLTGARLEVRLPAAAADRRPDVSPPA